MADIVIDRSDAQIKAGIEKASDLQSSASEIDNAVATSANIAGMVSSGADIDRSIKSINIPKTNVSIVADTLSIQTALDSGIKVYIPSDKTITINTLTMSSGSSMEIDGELVLAEGQAEAIKITHKDVSLTGSGILNGGSTTKFNIPEVTEGTRTGIKVYSATPSELEFITLGSLKIKGFDKTGLDISNTNSISSYIQSANINNLDCSKNYRGVDFGDKAEYISSSCLSATECHIGISVKGGNNKIGFSNFTNNFINCDLLDGINEGHGAFTACSFNHAAIGGLGIRGNGVNFGMVFNGCFLWHADMELNACFGVSFQNGQISNCNISVSGGGGGLITGNTLHENVTRSFLNFASIKWGNNKYFANSSENSLFNLYREYYVLAEDFGGINNTKGVDQIIYFKNTIEAKRNGMQDPVNVLVSNSRPYFSVAGTMDFDVQLMVRSHSGATDQFVTIKVVIYTDVTLTTVYDTIEGSYFIPSSQSTYIPIALRGLAKVLFGQMARIEITTSDVANGIDIQDVKQTRLKVQSLD